MRQEEPLSTTDAVLDGDFDITIETMKRVVYAKLGDYKFSDALAAIWAAISFGDRYVNDRKVWEIKDDAQRAAALFNLCITAWMLLRPNSCRSCPKHRARSAPRSGAKMAC